MKGKKEKRLRRS